MKNITIDQFVVLLDSAGVTAEQRSRLHRAFEQKHPEQHQAFLESLGAAPDEVKRIRSAAR